MAFIPLAFHPENTRLSHIPKPSAAEDLRQLAVARLVLDNFPHIKAYWIMMTPRIAQIAQRFGSDDLDGTVVEEKIYHDAGATTSQSLRRGELLRLIREAGREPLERDTLYRPVQRTEAAFTVLV
jgi:aminodeoxyfutalosine synthase